MREAQRCITVIPGAAAWARGLDRLDSEYLSQVSVKAVRASARRYYAYGLSEAEPLDDLRQGLVRASADGVA
jgi:hypothetical protein